MREGIQVKIRTSIQKMGNSMGVILSGKMLSELNLVEGSEVEISLSDVGILIAPVMSPQKVNRDLSDWDHQFKAAIKACDGPDKDFY